MIRVAARLEGARAALIQELRRDIRDRRVLDAITDVSRERFVPPDLQAFAYENRPLPIGQGQTISQPRMVALMTEALELRGDERVLEIGTGSGYQAAILSRLVAQVTSVERVQPLAEAAGRTLAELGYDNIRVYPAGEALGWPREAPYDAILVTAGAPDVPAALLDQLADYGRLVIPVGSRGLQELLQMVRNPGGIATRRMGPCRFVPLIAPSAWPSHFPY